MAQSDDMLAALGRMSRTLALVAVKGVPEGEAMDLLSRAGYSHKEIGQLLGKSSNAVEVRLRRSRKSSTKKGRKRAEA